MELPILHRLRKAYGSNCSPHQIVPKEKVINTKRLTPEKITIEHILQRASTM